MANISISQMNTRAEANLSDLHEVAYADGNSQTGYASGKMTMEVMANAIVNDFAYQSLGNKTVKGAIEDAEVTVDTALDTSSNNPIANSPVATAIQGTTTATTEGQVLTMESAGIYAEDVSVGIEPIQDLHGYDYPWVGGAGKNLMPINEVDQQYNTGITCNIPAGNYTMSYNAPDGKALACRFFYVAGDNDQSVVLGANERNVTFERTVVSYNLTVTNYSAGTTVTNIQLEQGNQATSYAPYSNICPISGYTECNVVRAGVNQWDEEVASGYYNANGEFVAGTNVASKNLMPCVGNTAYYFYGGPNANSQYRLCFYDINQDFIERTADSYVGTSFTTPINARYMTFYMELNPYGTTYNHDISINYPSTIATYQPYQGQTYTVSFNDTVYSGTLDVTTGILTVDKAMVDLGDLNWTKDTSNIGQFRTFGTDMPLLPMLIGTLICENYKGVKKLSSGELLNGEISVTNTQTIPVLRICDTTKASLTSEQFTTALDGVQLLYELATPQTIQLTPQQLQMLKGYNTVITDANGGMTIKYQPDNVVGECKEYAHKLYLDILDRLEALSE